MCLGQQPQLGLPRWGSNRQYANMHICMYVSMYVLNRDGHGGLTVVVGPAVAVVVALHVATQFLPTVDPPPLLVHYIYNYIYNYNIHCL